MSNLKTPALFLFAAIVLSGCGGKETVPTPAPERKTPPEAVEPAEKPSAAAPEAAETLPEKPGEWQYVVVSVDGDKGTMTLYVNGKEDADTEIPKSGCWNMFDRRPRCVTRAGGGTNPGIQRRKAKYKEAI
ncbi:MAG: LamG-like jellyroll fold domain-containing protein [Kiritimatiellia bacterium]